MAVDRRSGRAPRWKARLAPPSPTRPPRWLTVVLLAAALSLDSADRSTLSAVEAQLEAQLHIGPTGFGLLAALPPIVGMVATFPVGMLVDQITRTRLLGIVTALWALAEAVSTFSPSFAVLLVARIFLGGVLAAVPAVVSLAGDYYPVAERAGCSATSSLENSPAPPSDTWPADRSG